MEDIGFTGLALLELFLDKYCQNYTFWDHIFGTSVYEEDVMSLVYGLDTHMDEEDHTSVKNLLLIPFQTYREPIKRG